MYYCYCKHDHDGCVVDMDIDNNRLQVAHLEPCVQSLPCPLQDMSILPQLRWPLQPPLNQQIKQLPSAFLHIMRLAALLAVHETEHKSVDVRPSCVVAARQGYVGRHVDRCVYHAARQMLKKKRKIWSCECARSHGSCLHAAT